MSLHHITVVLEFSNIGKQEYVGMCWFREEEKNCKYVKNTIMGKKSRFSFSVKKLGHSDSQ